MTTIRPHSSKGRPRTFDRQAALKQALGVFWQRGYEPASLSELCTAMGIKPPSLYAAFGNKAQLFMEAVHFYEAEYWDATWEQMEQEPDLRRGVMEFFQASARILTSQDAPCGCLVVMADANLGEEGRAVNVALKALREEGRTCFVNVIAQAIEDGQLPRTANAAALGSALNTLLQGMSIQARDGASRAELEQIGVCALAMLPSESH